MGIRWLSCCHNVIRFKRAFQDITSLRDYSVQSLPFSYCDAAPSADYRLKKWLMSVEFIHLCPRHRHNKNGGDIKINKAVSQSFVYLQGEQYNEYVGRSKYCPESSLTEASLYTHSSGTGESSMNSWYLTLALCMEIYI